MAKNKPFTLPHLFPNAYSLKAFKRFSNNPEVQFSPQRLPELKINFMLAL